MLKKMLHDRNIPPFEAFNDWGQYREKIVKLLCNEVYGFLPKTEIKLSFSVSETEPFFCAGKVSLSKIILTAEFENGSFSFPFYSSIPNENKKHPFFVLINSRDNVPDRYLPIEEICDNGFAVLSFCYKDVTSDDDDFNNGLSKLLYDQNEKKDNDCGKIRMWSWAASKIMDYAMTLPKLDLKNAYVAGHSRLGKTALLTSALDERFSAVISNDSGLGGAALTRGKNGEGIEDICRQFPFWFCNNYKKYIDDTNALPFDQHFLLAASAPRRVYIASALEDYWADPNSEYLSCVAASDIYIKLGLTGFIHPDKLPTPGNFFHGGNIGYHLRNGKHYLSREDWAYFMKFLNTSVIPR